MLALRNTLLMLLGVSIPLVAALGCQVFADNYPQHGLLVASLNTWVVYALWGYVVVLGADAYHTVNNLQED